MDNQDNNKTKVNHPILDNNNDPVLDNDPSLDNNDPSLDSNDPVLDSTEPISNNNFKEETSAELMDEEANWNTRDDDNDHFATGSMMGWIGIALSVLSFFMIPILFAGAGIILGIIARMREANTLGYTAIAVGVVSLIVRLFFAPF